MKRSSIAFAVSLALLLNLCSLGAASAAYSYNANAALNYASQHWNDGGGLCAEFVCRCVQAGGLGISTNTYASDSFELIERASGLTRQQLALDSNGNATKSANQSILSAGDVVLQRCFSPSCPDYLKSPHILLCNGYNSSGNAVYYAHNSAMNGSQTYNLRRNTAYNHTSSCDMRGFVLHISAAAVSPPKVPAKPANLRASQASPTTGYVAWDSVSGATSYEVRYRSKNTGNEWRSDSDYSEIA